MTKVRNSLLLNRQVDQARDFELKSLFEHLYYNYKVKLIVFLTVLFLRNFQFIFEYLL